MKKEPPPTLTPLRQFIEQHKKFFKIIVALGGAYAFIVLACVVAFLCWFIPTWNQRHQAFQERWAQSMQESRKDSEEFRKSMRKSSEEFAKKIKESSERSDAEYRKFMEDFNKGDWGKVSTSSIEEKKDNLESKGS